MLKKLLLLWFISFGCLADMQCGPFLLTASNDGFMHINGQRPETQKLTFLKDKDDYSNVKMQWMLMDKQTERWLGFDYIKKNKKGILNVESVRRNLDEPRIFGTYDCVKVK